MLNNLLTLLERLVIAMEAIASSMGPIELTASKGEDTPAPSSKPKAASRTKAASAPVEEEELLDEEEESDTPPPKKKARKPAAAKKASKPAESLFEEEEDEVDIPTVEKVRGALASLADATSTNVAKAVLKKFGVSTVSALPEDRRAELIDICEAKITESEEE